METSSDAVAGGLGEAAGAEVFAAGRQGLASTAAAHRAKMPMKRREECIFGVGKRIGTENE